MSMRRKLLMAVMAASLWIPLGPLPAQAHPTYCSLGQTVWQKSEMYNGTWRRHKWKIGTTTYQTAQLWGTGIKDTNTGVQNVADSWYETNHSQVFSFTAYCKNGPS